MKYWLLIILSTEIGFGAGEPVYFKGPKPYDSLEECMERGLTAAQWLHQDFVTVKVECMDHEFQGDVLRDDIGGRSGERREL